MSKSGKAKVEAKDDLKVTLGEIRKAIPAEFFVKNEFHFLVNVAYSVSFTVILLYLARLYIPFTWMMLPVWLIYAAFTGTVATGIWVLGHECGHGSFSDSNLLNDGLGFILHTILLVPYFSWQHSHAVHHSKTNHLTEGETHCPQTSTSKMGQFYLKLRDIMGIESFACMQMFNISVLGWPLYLLLGCTGGPARGFTSHFFVPNQLLPQRLIVKVHLSNLGLIMMGYVLYLWIQATSFAEVACLYFGPYLVVNAYLTIITYLQHTDAEVPHYDETTWTWLKGSVTGFNTIGALATIDRNYPPWIDSLQWYIGTTHVVHHIFSDLPHYHAKEANVYVKQVLGELHYSDQKNVFVQLYQTAKLAAVESRGNGVWKFI